MLIIPSSEMNLFSVLHGSIIAAMASSETFRASHPNVPVGTERPSYVTESRPNSSVNRLCSIVSSTGNFDHYTMCHVF